MSEITRDFTPDEWLDFGILGECPVTFTAVINAEQNRFGWSYDCKIMKANIELSLNESKQIVDVTFAFLKNKWLREEWESRILRDYKSALNESIDEAYDRTYDQEGT